MAYNIIGFLLVVGGLAIVILLFIRKAPQVALIDVEHAPKEKEEDKKQRMVEQRLRRNVLAFFDRLSELFEPAQKFLGHVWGRVLDAIHRLEERSKHYKKEILKQDRSKMHERVAELLVKGEGLLAEGNYPEAEQVLIEVVSLDRRNVDAYRHLAEVYTAMRQYDHAREVWVYIERLTSRDETVLTNLGALYVAEERHELAYEHFREALSLAPKNPRLLDLFIEECILLKKREEAREALHVLRMANPDNQKLEDFEERIEVME